MQILLPGPHADKRFVQLAGEAMYPRLLASGVELWNFQPTMMHAKVMTVDGVVANIGSANLNARSTVCDEEINVVALDAELVQVLDEQFDEDLERSVRIEPGRWKERSLPQRAGGAGRQPDPPLVLRNYCRSHDGDGRPAHSGAGGADGSRLPLHHGRPPRGRVWRGDRWRRPRAAISTSR